MEPCLLQGLRQAALRTNQIAGVLTFIRNSWGNSASAISASEVQEVADSLKDRPAMQMWTAAELTSHSNQE